MKTIDSWRAKRLPHTQGLFAGVLLLAILTAAACTISAPQASPRLPKQPLQVQLEPLSAPARSDEVWLMFTLTNVSSMPLYVLQWYTPLEGIAGEIFQVQYKGRTIPYEGPLVMRDVPLREEYLLLEPGQSAVAEVDLAGVYDFSRPGEYTIQFISPSISRLARSPEEIAQAIDDLHPVEMPANPVHVWIVPELD